MTRDQRAIRNAIALWLRGAKPMRLAGPTLSVWRREKRGWVIARDGNFVQPVEK